MVLSFSRVLVATLLQLVVGTAQAQDAATIAGVRVGFAGHYRVGFWTPVEVTVRGGSDPVSGHLSLSLVDGDGLRYEVVGKQIDVSSAGETRVTVYVRFGNTHSNLTIALRDGEQTLAERAFSAGDGGEGIAFERGFASTQGLILTLGNPIGVEEAVGRAREQAEKFNVVHLPDAMRLPDEWLGYDGIDQLVIGPAPPRLDEALSADSRLLVALDRWLAEGGQLVLALGSDSERFLTDDLPLAKFLPGKVEGAAKLTRTTSLEMFGGTYGGAPLRWGRGERRALSAARLVDVHGHVALGEGDFPLIVRRPYEFGTVTFAAVDFSQPPLADWAGKTLSVKRLLGQQTKNEEKEESDRAPPPAVHLGLIDLSGQLRSALDQFRGVELAPFWMVAGLAVIYIALVGPLDFLLLKTLVRRMEWTWFTFPLVVLVFCVGAGWAAYRLKGDRLLVNQVDLVDVDLASKRVRGTTWFNLFSPATTTYDLTLRPQLPVRQPAADLDVVLSWQGLPGNVLGGMEQGVSAPGSAATSYQISAARDQLLKVPIPIWSTKSFVGRWHTEVDQSIVADLKSGRDNVVEGTITNRLNLPLTNCMLVSGRWAWQFAELKPDVAVRVRSGEQRDLFALLKDFKLTRERDKDTLIQVATPYDQTSFNVGSIVQQMMFYEGANGRSYTGLLNRYQSYVDLSDHLELGQIILWGTAERPAAAIERSGQPLTGSEDAQKTFYRFLITLP